MKNLEITFKLPVRGAGVYVVHKINKYKDHLMPFLLAGAKGGKSCCCCFFYILGSTYYGQHKLLLLTTVNNFLCIDWVVFIHIHKKKCN